MVVGGGIVGLATARAASARHVGLRVVVLEKEARVAAHQTGRNSGVIHSGVYYAPGSRRARMCVEGAARMYEFCAENGVPHRRAGKLIVATSEAERRELDALHARGVANGVPGLEMLGAAEALELEPHVRCVAALHCPSTGIADYAAAARAMAGHVAAAGGRVETRFEAVSIDDDGGERVVRAADGRTVRAPVVITCAGLQADRVAALAGGGSQPAIVPFRGRYLRLREEFRHVVRRNIYPVKRPEYPWLGVHLTPTVHGDVLLGPNAVLAASREGYSAAAVSARDVLDAARHRGLRDLARQHLAYGLGEMGRDLVPAATVRQLRAFLPWLEPRHVERAPPSTVGVRALAMDEGGMLDDFAFEAASPGVLHVRNAPSPACTASLSIADAVVAEAERECGLGLRRGRSLSST